MARILDNVREEEELTPPHSAAPRATRLRQAPLRSASYDHSTVGPAGSRTSFSSAFYTSTPALPSSLQVPRPLDPNRRPSSAPLAPPMRAPQSRKPPATAMIDLSAPSTFSREGYKNRPFSSPESKEERFAVGDWLAKLEKRKARDSAPKTSRIMDFDELDAKHKRRLSKIQGSARDVLELEAAKKHYEEQKNLEAKHEQARQARQRKQQRRDRFTGFFSRHHRTPPSVVFTPPTPVKTPPATVSPSPSGPLTAPSLSFSAQTESKRMSSIPRVEEWRSKSQTELLCPPRQPAFGNGGPLASRSAPDLGLAYGGGKHSWLEY